MLYFTGGGAWENVVHSPMVSTDTTAGTYSNSAAGSLSTTKSGFVIGGGYEWMVAQHWMVRGEYLFYDFNNNTDNISFVFPTCSAAGSCGANVSTADKRMNVFRLGASYKF